MSGCGFGVQDFGLRFGQILCAILAWSIARVKLSGQAGAKTLKPYVRPRSLLIILMVLVLPLFSLVECLAHCLLRVDPGIPDPSEE